MTASRGGKIAVGFTAFVVGTAAGAYLSGALDDIVSAPVEETGIDVAESAPADGSIFATTGRIR